MPTPIIVILAILVLGSLALGVRTLLWSRSDEGVAQSRGHELGWW